MIEKTDINVECKIVYYDGSKMEIKPAKCELYFIDGYIHVKARHENITWGGGDISIMHKFTKPRSLNYINDSYISGCRYGWRFILQGVFMGLPKYIELFYKNLDKCLSGNKLEMCSEMLYTAMQTRYAIDGIDVEARNEISNLDRFINMISEVLHKYKYPFTKPCFMKFNMCIMNCMFKSMITTDFEGDANSLLAYHAEYAGKGLSKHQNEIYAL